MQNFCSMLHSFIGCDAAASPVAGPEPAPMDGENQLTGARGHVQQHQKKGEKITTEHTWIWYTCHFQSETRPFHEVESICRDTKPMSSVYCLLEKSVIRSFLRTGLLNGQFLSNACMEMNQLRRSWIRCLCKQTSCISLMMDRFFHEGFPNHETVSSEEITNYPLGCTNHDVYILDCIVIALASCQ